MTNNPAARLHGGFHAPQKNARAACRRFAVVTLAFILWGVTVWQGAADTAENGRGAAVPP